ncbi:MAG: putative sulfate exporter family transporter [Bacteroides sp.]|nr:putative sulfate exporter family transporter [Bacteroidales bacterium]MBD5367648.1 putative sulfate exporter family transporter [Bacteroides sp.]
MNQSKKWIYIILMIMCVAPVDLLEFGQAVTPAVALFLGLAYALIAGECPYPKFNKKTSKYLLQASVVGLGFGMNLYESLRSGSEGMMFSIVSVIGVMLIGVAVGRILHINRKTSYLISSGTAICGGSAIAAVGPVMKADENEMAVSLGVIFILNAVALFIFPSIGEWAEMSQQQFGTWAAIAIHDTSSVVGAGEAYGPEALQIATLVKLTRALWIIPLALVTMVVFRDKSGKISIPWFIFLFVLAMIANTFLSLPESLTRALVYIAKKGLVLTLFCIGASLSLKTIRNVGFKPMMLAIMLWIIIGVSSFFVVMATIS